MCATNVAVVLPQERRGVLEEVAGDPGADGENRYTFIGDMRRVVVGVIAVLMYLQFS